MAEEQKLEEVKGHPLDTETERRVARRIELLARYHPADLGWNIWNMTEEDRRDYNELILHYPVDEKGDIDFETAFRPAPVQFRHNQEPLYALEDQIQGEVEEPEGEVNFQQPWTIPVSPETWINRIENNQAVDRRRREMPPFFYEYQPHPNQRHSI